MTNRIVGWIQSNDPTISNQIYYNGQIIKTSDRRYSSLYQFITEREKFNKVFDNNELSVYNKGVSEFLIFSNFGEKDIANRKIAFMCRFKCTYEDLISCLSQFADGVNHTLAIDDISIINQVLVDLKKKQRSKIILSVIGIIIIITLITLILK